MRETKLSCHRKKISRKASREIFYGQQRKFSMIAAKIPHYSAKICNAT
jgi:hypothetical protein